MKFWEDGWVGTLGPWPAYAAKPYRQVGQQQVISIFFGNRLTDLELANMKKRAAGVDSENRRRD
jgi:hypothetical protein